jgi:hypothetical protein
MAMGLTRPVIEMSTRNFHGDKERPTRKNDNFAVICEQIV